MGVQGLGFRALQGLRAHRGEEFTMLFGRLVGVRLSETSEDLWV